jgi:DNA polymerase-3 subunit gamma/tau
VRDALSVLGQLLAGASPEGVTYEIAVQLLGFTDGALLDEAIDALAARDSTTIFNTIDRVIESGLDPRRFTQDFLERLRDLIIVGAVKEKTSHVLRDFPEDQLERMQAQANLIGAATLIRAADITSAGLTEMRGATAPRLILELICGRILLPASDDAALIARIERLERGVNLVTHSAPAPASESVTSAAPSTAKAPVESKVAAPKTEPAKAAPAKSAPATEVSKSAPPAGPVDISSLRKLWPEVIENVKKRRRLTWSLISASAQVLAVDDKAITIGIVNGGARDSFMRSGSDDILAAAFQDVTGLVRTIDVVVDPSISAPQYERTTEELSDPDQLSGTALLARELGAQVIREFER